MNTTVKRIGIVLAFLTAAAATWSAPAVTVSNALSLHDVPKYGPGFTHFDYVNPDAPKGGTMRQSIVGTFDNFNAFAQRGVAEANASSFYDTLMSPSEDEVEVYYGLVAQKVEYPADYTWIIFDINPRATNQDGSSITADEVVFSFNKFVNEGVPQFKQYYANVSKVEALDPLRVKFTLAQGDKALMVSLAQLNILPQKYWQSRNLADPLTEIPLGSGAYTVKDYKIGEYAVYQRIPNYWGADLPVNKGQLNFDALRFDYYRDQTVAFQAFTAGEYDLYQESISKNWATMYTGKNFDNGAILKEEIPHQIPQGMQALVFNIQRPLFMDVRVREALGYALDFQWMNKNLFYSQYTRSRSYFINTPYEAKGLPSAAELAILEPLRGKIPPRVFTTEYNPPVTDGTGEIGPQLEKAFALLKDAGWEVKSDTGKLTNTKNGDEFSFELLIYDPSEQRIAIPVQQNLKRMGITMTIRQVDAGQFTNRLRTRDFDMISGGYDANYYPSTDMKIVWRSDYLADTYNQAGVQDPAVDALIDGIVAHQDDPAALLNWGHALDRVLTWNFYVIPEWYLSKFRVAYWNKFSRPAVRPKYTLGLGSWWLDKDKEARLPKG